MKITDLLSSPKISLSFEVFPPKSESGYGSVREATEEIAKLRPSFMSVTYGAGGGTSAYTLEIARTIKERYGVPSIAHLTCVSSSRETVHARIREIREAGIENIMALRGDIPAGMENAPRTYTHAVELIRELRESDAGFCIGGACYPEVHPESKSCAEDIRYLKEKVDAGCDFLTTQMFFDNAILYRFLYKAREAGIAVPVIPGIMPITNAAQLDRAVHLSGCSVPQRFLSIVDRFGRDPDAMKQAGIAYATDQIIDLFANGISHVHVYSMNKPDVAEGIYRNLSQLLGK